MTKTSRRQFLQGAAGFTLSLPFLESLAGEPPYALHSRFVCMTTVHGAVWGSNLFPDDATATETLDMYPGHTAHHGPLSLDIAGGMAELSPMLRADSSLLTSSLADKMMVLRGFDVPWRLGHHSGGELGNYAAHFDGIDDNSPVQQLVPTIDQVMAYSPSVYPDLGSIRQRSMHIGTGTHRSWGYANPGDPNSVLQPTPLSQSASALFNQIFVPPEEEENTRPLIVDRVIDHYRHVRDGAFGDATRLSSRDRQRLDDHMDRLRDLETRLSAVADCSSVQPLGGDTNGLDVNGYSTNVSDMITYYQLYNDVVAAAFICGTSRIAVINSYETWSTQYSGLCCDWHQEVAHRAHEPDGNRQQLQLEAKRTFFQNVFLDLCHKLDVDEANGMTYLDNSFVFWTDESGPTTHDGISIPIISAGSGAGYFDTGRYVDYRNRNNTSKSHDYSPEHQAIRTGIPYHRFLANAMMAMNMQPAEFERPGEHGYGVNFIEDTAAWPQPLMDDASLPLPIVTS